MHIHVDSPDGTMKVWLEPEVAIVYAENMKQPEAARALEIVAARSEEFKNALKNYFSA